jgi:hypothetical protein
MSASISPETILAIAVRAVLAGSLLAACSATPTSSPQPIAPRPTAAQSGPIAVREGPASAGTYTTSSFEPTVVLTLPSDGWSFFFQDDDDEMALGKGDVELIGGRVANVLDPATRATVPAPDDLVVWFASHPRLKAETPRPASVGGLVGQSIDVTNPGTSDIDIFAYPTGNLRVAAGTTARVWVLPFDGPDLVFTGFSPSARFEQALPTLQPVVDSIVIAPG